MTKTLNKASHWRGERDRKILKSLAKKGRRREAKALILEATR